MNREALVRGLERLPRHALGHFPTPLEPLPRLSARWEGPELWVKRDDQTGLAGGGNKTRKLEFLVADALRQGADTLVTGGAAQSNHVRQTAAAAAKLGLRCHLVLKGSPTAPHQGNLLLDQLLGAEIHWTQQELPQALATITQSLQAQGHRAYLIPYGGSNGLGVCGYAAAWLELEAQMAALGLAFDAVIVASSSGGTQSGLALGAQACGYRGRLIGISIAERAEALRSTLRALVEEAQAMLGLPIGAPAFEVDDSWLGAGYGIPAAEELATLREVARTEGLLVDPVYTGRALTGLRGLIARGELRRGQRVLFWHTGGVPALFAYAEQVL